MFYRLVLFRPERVTFLDFRPVYFRSRFSFIFCRYLTSCPNCLRKRCGNTSLRLFHSQSGWIITQYDITVCPLWHCQSGVCICQTLQVPGQDRGIAAVEHRTREAIFQSGHAPFLGAGLATAVSIVPMGGSVRVRHISLFSQRRFLLRGGCTCSNLAPRIVWNQRRMLNLKHETSSWTFHGYRSLLFFSFCFGLFV